MVLSGNPADYLKAFFGGVLISFTPCIYPLIPISASYIGANSANSKLRGFILSLVYVTGVAVTYSILGIIASLTGTFFGKISTHPVTYIIVGVMVAIFGFSMLDFFTFPGINFIKLPALKKGNLLSTFALGLSSGLIASPCLTPVLSSILLYLATKKNMLYGATLLLSFAYGMGVILIAVGTFSSLIASIPKSGKWLNFIKRACAIILLAMGIFFIFSGISKISNVAWAQESQPEATSVAPDFKLEDTNGVLHTLSSYKNKQPVLLFFWTTWCPFCQKELAGLNNNYTVLKSEGIELLAINAGESLNTVQRLLKKVNPVFTVLLDKDTEVASAFFVLGVPTYILIDKNGQVVYQDNSFPGDLKELIKKPNG
ncbi:MAG: cytochrome c biogenesis protein CcdA [Candidatus Omnitrophica bacterium]|nr:cytochrome c biogenesis protein CcdA [Candidatus Omnitrophota bacterium]MDD5653161.1 cytochrome c biogenesis protein CcdA [Candidatus Omnitrophota bacterium]